MPNHDFTDDFAWYACLATQHYLGPVGFKALVAGFGSPREVYGASQAARKEMHPALQAKMATSLAKGPDFRAWEVLLGECVRGAITIAAPGDSAYPRVLEALDAPPPLLFLRGAWRPGDARAVALVGTRTPTAYGREAAWTLARDLGAAGCAVVSGLAVGIDAAAHAGALASGGRTLAVIGCGLDQEYPAENRELRAAIEERGAVISEHPPGTPPQQMNFPRRNRIISALSRGVVVVEAGARSGALLTADHARLQGKPLFAVPGPIFSSVSEGTHALLREGRAALATSAREILAGLDGEVPANVDPARKTVPPADGKRTARPKAKAGRDGAGPFSTEPSDPVLRLWEGDEVCGVDALTARAEAAGLWPAGAAASGLLEALLMREMTGQVQRLPGPSYRRVGRQGQ
jgi:DNA processing protein